MLCCPRTCSTTSPTTAGGKATSTWGKSSTPNCSMRSKAALGLLGLGLLVVASAALGAAVGSTVIDLPAALWELLDGEAASPDARILLHVRLPRVCASLLCGSALAVSGMLIQAVLSNPRGLPQRHRRQRRGGVLHLFGHGPGARYGGGGAFGRLYRGPVRHFDRIRRGGGGRRGQADHHPGGCGGEQHLHRGHQHHQDLFPGYPLQRQHLFDWGPSPG